jgi:hypothetical protein
MANLSDGNAPGRADDSDGVAAGQWRLRVPRLLERLFADALEIEAGEPSSGVTGLATLEGFEPSIFTLKG